jgi:hypothetical protein
VFDGDHDVSDLLPSLDVPVRLDDLRRRVAAVDDRSEPPGLHQVLEVIHHRLIMPWEPEQTDLSGKSGVTCSRN